MSWCRLFTKYRQLSTTVRLFSRRHQSFVLRWQPPYRRLFTIVSGGTLLGGLVFHVARSGEDERSDSENRDPPTTTNSRAVIVSQDYKTVVEQCRRIVQFKREEIGAPAIVVGVSVDGELVWQEGFGYSDVENLIPCRADAALRLASISKPITAAMAARLIDQGKLDIDKPIQHYIPKYPLKTVNGRKVDITTRHLLSQLGGIRHYEKGSTKDSISEGEMTEFYIKDEYKSVTEALKIFMDDDLEHEPGSKFLYTTHGWTLISAVLEGASGQNFVNLTKNLYQDLGMNNSYLGYHIPMIRNQARYYRRNEKGRLENAPYVDVSWKWAGGGLVSTVEDLCLFGNHMLYSYQTPHGYIEQTTMQQMWKVAEKSRDKVKWLVSNGGYGQGWGVDEGNNDTKKGAIKPFLASHTGGGCGASTVLTIIPSSNDDGTGSNYPKGVVIAILTNLHAVSMAKLALEIGLQFNERNGQECR